MESYAERIENRRPSCWGNEDTYDPEDGECIDCEFRHTCRDRVTRDRDRRDRVHVPVSRVASARTTSYPRRVPREEPANSRAGDIGPGEIWYERLAKDALIGGVRGVLGEAYEFFRNYRIP